MGRSSSVINTKNEMNSVQQQYPIEQTMNLDYYFIIFTVSTGTKITGMTPFFKKLSCFAVP